MNLRIELEVNADAEEPFSCFGLTVTDAVNVFLRQSIMQGGFPFEIVRYKPNEVTKAAIELLATNGFLPLVYNDHPLVGNKKGLR